MNKLLKKKKRKCWSMNEGNAVLEEVDGSLVAEDSIASEDVLDATDATMIVSDEAANEEVDDSDLSDEDEQEDPEVPWVYIDPTGAGRTLMEVIAEERLEKVSAHTKLVKQLGKNPNLLSYTLVIQRKLKWSDHQKSELIESAILGYPVPAIYTLKSDNKQIQLLEGQQRTKTYTTFFNNEWALDTLPDAFGVKLTGKYFKDLPSEFQEVISDVQITFYQYEKLEDYQRDQIFRRLNSGTALTAIEIIRAILGSEHLQYVMDITKNSFFQYVQLTPNQTLNFVDEELVLQLIGLLTGKTKDAQRDTITILAEKLRDFGLTDGEKQSIAATFDYLTAVFADVDPKIRKSILKKNDIVAIVNAVDLNLDPKETGEKLATYLKKNQSAEYKRTKSSSGAKQTAVFNRVAILKDVIGAKQAAKV